MEREYKLGNEMTEQEIDDFFESEWIDVDFWTEGQGSAAISYAVYKNDDGYIITIEPFSFGGYEESTYYFITINN
jgi:hypothetical protein